MQTLLELQSEFMLTDNYKQALSLYHKEIKRTEIHPVFLCYNKKNKAFYVSAFFSREMVENFARIIL